jgi:hypothetical protein
MTSHNVSQMRGNKNKGLVMVVVVVVVMAENTI